MPMQQPGVLRIMTWKIYCCLLLSEVCCTLLFTILEDSVCGLTPQTSGATSRIVVVLLCISLTVHHIERLPIRAIMPIFFLPRCEGNSQGAAREFPPNIQTSICCLRQPFEHKRSTLCSHARFSRICQKASFSQSQSE